MKSQQQIEDEMSYNTWGDSCKVHGPATREKTGNIIVTLQRRCRRPRGHEGKHASGFGRSHVQWVEAFENLTPDPMPN